MRTLPLAALSLTLLAACGSEPPTATSPTENLSAAAASAAASAPSSPEAIPPASAALAAHQEPLSGGARDKAIKDATENVKMIGRSAQGAFERESIDPNATKSSKLSLIHLLCKSATPVPSARLAKGALYTWSDKDFDGDDTTGWKCLRYTLTGSSYFQYSYVVGGPYKSTFDKYGAEKSTDPGPAGFEACAEGDLGHPSGPTLICVTGTIDTKKNEVKVSGKPVVINGNF